MKTEERYKQIKRKVNSLATQVAEAEGALKQNLKRLKDECGCNSLEEAEERLAQLRRSESKIEKKLSRLVTQFEEKWGEVLQEED